MPSKPRLPTNVIDDLAIVEDQFREVWGLLDELDVYADKIMDLHLLAYLGKLNRALARIDRKTRDARRNIFDPLT
jgi:hypothetical protein